MTTATDVAAATRHLVAYRDGLATHLVWLAKATADLASNEQTEVFARLLAVLGPDEAMRRGAQIATLTTPCWGLFAEIGAQRIASVDLLRRVCVDTATAVRDAMHRDSCICEVKR